jgi:uncharacterized protein (TIGR03435 family)
MRANLTIVLTAFVIWATAVAGQSAPPDVRFEAVSIKPHNPAVDRVSTGVTGSEWIATGASLLLLLQNAFPDFADEGRILGAHDWMLTTTFDVRAKANGTLRYPAATTMIRNMLIDRFGVRSHVEPRAMDVYAARLVDAKPGEWLSPTAPDCVAARGTRGTPPASCERLLKQRQAKGEVALTLLGSPLPVIFATFRQVGGFDRLIVDRTGLIGLYDVSVKYGAANSLDAKDGATSLATAARDQLGLTFEPARETLDVLVIDAAHMPEPD